MKNYGKLDWAISAGRAPFLHLGVEPEFTSHDKLSILNLSDEESKIVMHVFYEDEPPVAYEIRVQPNRLKKIRFNDLIDPVAMQLEKNFACYIRSDVPVVVQFSRMNTGSEKIAEMSAMAYPVDD